MIRFEKVSKTYPGHAHAALDQVSVDVDKGEFVFLVGSSGSGKSTFLRLVLREYRPTAGRVYVAGKELNRLASWKVPRLAARTWLALSLAAVGRFPEAVREAEPAVA